MIGAAAMNTSIANPARAFRATSRKCTIMVPTKTPRRPISVRATAVDDLDERSRAAESPSKSAPDLKMTSPRDAPPRLPEGQLLGSDKPKIGPEWLSDKYWLEGPEEFGVLKLMREWGAKLSVSGTDDDTANPAQQGTIGVFLDQASLYGMMIFLPIYAILLYQVYQNQ